MLPAMRQALNGSRDDDHLDRLFGPSPRMAILAVTLLGLLIGYALQALFSEVWLLDYIHVPAVLFAAGYALLYRQYLFGTAGAGVDDFRWLAGALIPPAAAMVIIAFVLRASGGLDPLPGAPGWTVIGDLLDAAADSLSPAAGLTIAVASLCYSKDWWAALKALIKRLIIFKIVIWIMILIFVEIGFVGAILGALVESLLGINLPHWLGDFADQLTYALLISTIYLAIIGGTWTACSRAFPKLMVDGEVDILQELETMAETPAKRRVKARKARAAAKKHPR